MKKKLNQILKSAANLVSVSSDSVHKGLESITTKVTKVAGRADQLNSSFAQKANSFLSGLMAKIKS